MIPIASIILMILISSLKYHENLMKTLVEQTI